MALQMAQQSPPGMFNLEALNRTILNAANMPNIEEILPLAPKPQPLDPVSDIAAATKGIPISAFPGQNHDAHIQVKMSYLSDPMNGANPIMARLKPVLEANIQEHSIMKYQEQMSGTSKVMMEQMPQQPQQPTEIEAVMAAAAQDVLNANIAMGKQMTPEQQLVALEQSKVELEKEKIKLDAKKWTDLYFKERKEFLNNRENENLGKNFPIQPKGLFKQLRKVLPKNSAITLDAGTLCLQATDALEYYDPPSLFTPLDFGLVGFSFACGLGVKVAKPKKTVVSLMGDGGFGMTISELSTAVEYGINTTTIVMNNQSWGAEKAYQKDFFGKRYLGADITSPSFDKVAELYGAKGFKVKKVSEINEAVRAAIKSNKPSVIDVDVDPKALYSFRRDSFQHRIKK